MTQNIGEMFYRDDISKDITSVACGSTWLCFYREALVAVSHVNSVDNKVEAAMVKLPTETPIAYKSYHEWYKNWQREGEKIARDFALNIQDYEAVSAADIQALAIRWLGNQIAHVVGERLIGQD